MDGLRCLSGSGSYGEHRPLAVAATARKSVLEQRRPWTKLPCRWPRETPFQFIGFVLIERILEILAYLLLTIPQAPTFRIFAPICCADFDKNNQN
jgi:hypothetical protein